MEASSKNKPWRMEHRDLYPFSVFGPGVDKWITWNTPFSLKVAVKKLASMMDRQRREVYYTYRIRNLESGEIIPGEIFCG